MTITRRACLSLIANGAVAAWSARLAAADDEAATRIGAIVEAYDRQGFHRTGTTVDRASGDWLCDEVRHAGSTPTRETLSLQRVDPITGALSVEGRRVDGLPLFDAAFTDANGIAGRLGPLGSDAEIGLGDTVPNAAGTGPLGDARRAKRHRAIVCVTRGATTGLCPSNADAFREPFGPPVLQVSSEHEPWLRDAAGRGAHVRLVAHVKRTTASTFNVTATIDGADRTAAPLVVSTPRSGWYACASERGGGIACWLETMRALRGTRPARTVVFVAFTGHEVGYLGVHDFHRRRPDILSGASAWIHFGANIGAAVNAANRLAAASDELDGVATRAMQAETLAVDQRTKRGDVPGGEAEVVHHAGGRYIAVTGRNALFHNIEDRVPRAIDSDVIARFSRAFGEVARLLSAR